MILLTLVVAISTGCRQNPYPDGPGRFQVEEPKAPREVLPPFGISVPGVLDFLEGEERKFKIEARVPTGTPVITILNLPVGATFNGDTNEVVWTPTFLDANDENDPTVKMRTYPVTVELRSSEDPITSVTKDVILVVTDSPREFKFDSSNSQFNLREGFSFQQKVKIKSEDFPNGPFTLEVQNIPPGATVEVDPTDSTLFLVSYVPTHHDTKLRLNGKPNATNCSASTSSFCSVRKMNLVAYDPSGNKTVQAITWETLDSRQKPMIIAPKTVKQGLNVEFSLSAVDLNGEDVSDVEVVAPGFGDPVEVTDVSSQLPSGVLNPTKLLNVKWLNIPASKSGSTYDLKINACVWSTPNVKKLCSSHTVTVDFSKDEHLAPLVDRTEWNLSTVKYVREGESFQINLPVSDAEGNSVEPTVEIQPASMQSQVKWNNGVLTVSPSASGLQQFSVVAQSSFGVKTNESFIVDALPSTWSETLVLAVSTNNAETSKSTKLFSGANVVNPELQALDEKTLALRTSVVVTSSVLASPAAVAVLEKAVGQIDNLYLMSPLLENLTGDLKTELNTLKVRTKGRFASLSTAALSDFKFEFNSALGLTAPSKDVQLAGALTSESASPLALELSSVVSECKAAMSITNAAATEEYLMAVQCDRANGGKLIIAGFEWGDLKLDPSEATLSETWLKELVK